jgi:hypothetical protein
MGIDLNRGDLEYGYPSFERGTKFSLETNCLYFDILNYDASNGTVTEAISGLVDKTEKRDLIF